MPAAAYEVSKNEQSKLHGRDQSFRNCVVTMFVFIILCVIIILATIPWRNTSLRRNNGRDAYNKPDNPNTGKQSQEKETRDTSVSQYSTSPTTKFRALTTASMATTTIGGSRSTPTTTTKGPIASPPTVRQIIVETTTTRKTGGILSTITLKTTESPTTPRDNVRTSSRKLWNSEVSTTRMDNNIGTLPSTTYRNIGSSSTKTQDNGTSSTISDENIDPSRKTSRNIRPFSSTTPNSFATSEKKSDGTGISTTIFDENIDSTRTSMQNFGTQSTAVRNNVAGSSERNRDNVGMSSTTSDENPKVISSATTEKRVFIWNRNRNDHETSSTQTRENAQTSSSPMNGNIVPSTFTTRHDSESSSTSSVSTSQPTLPASTIVSFQTETSDEISSTTSTQDQVTSLSDSNETSTQSSAKTEVPSFSSSMSTGQQFTNESGLLQTEAIEETSVASSTESLIDISSVSVESTETSDYPTTNSEIPDTSGKNVTSEKDGRFPSLKTLLVSTYHGNLSNVSVTEMDEDWLDEFEYATTLINENNYTREFEKILAAATQPAKNDSNNSMTNVFETITGIDTSATEKISTDKVENETRQTSNDGNQDPTAIQIYTDESQKQSTPNTFDQVTDDITEENNKTTDEVCLSGHCKQFASRMMSYINHCADPCEDFYEYACGGMEADPQINDRNLADQAYDRIESQLKKSKNNEYLAFKNYYNSCIEYYQDTTQDEKIQQARKMLIYIGQLSTEIHYHDHHPGITQLIAFMMLHDNPLLFDIVPDIDEEDPQKFILRLGPVINNQRPFHKFEKNSCSMEDYEHLSNEIDLEKLYEKYEDCKNNERHLPESVTQTLRIFHTSNRTDATRDELNSRYEIATELDRQLIKVFANYPRINRIHENYQSKNYSIITIDALQNQIKFINWIELIQTVTKRNWTSDTKLQIYMKDELINVLKSLENVGELYEIHNALSWLYARNLYEQFVKPRAAGYSEKQCLHIAMNYLPNDASRLYHSSFTEKEMEFINSTINKVFKNLKETLKLKFERIQWVTQAHRDELMKKIADIQISSPNNLYSENIVNINITDKFFDSTIRLMKRLREDIYRNINKIPSDPKQLWTYFAKPFQPLSQAIHSLNIILIPFGAIDISHMMQSDNNFNYITFATVGNLIAREIAHYFDGNGFLYWNGAHSSASAFQRSEYSTYEDYINCHRFDLFKKPINMTLLASNKHIHIMIPPATVNERLSDVMGVRLAHETLARMELTSSKLLPWLDLDIHQLFYLAYAQRYCTKVPLTSSYVSLYENLIMPSRLRIFAAALNNKDLGELWKCREGSPVLPNFTCGIFPDLEYVDMPISSV